MGSHESPLLTDQQVRDASPDQLEDLVEQINLALRELAARLELMREERSTSSPGGP